MCSLSPLFLFHSSELPDTGRSVTLWPHGVLFRDAESDIRRKMIEGDYVDAVIGLGKNLFYNSSMESCLLVCRMKKPEERKGRIIFINAVKEVRLERSSAWLEPQHIKKIVDAYLKFKDMDGFAKVMSKEDVLGNNGNLSIGPYVQIRNRDNTEQDIENLISEIKIAQSDINKNIDGLFEQLQDLGLY